MSKQFKNLTLTIEAEDVTFLVAEQDARTYKLHLFEDEAAFKAWRKNHPVLRLVARAQARGRMLPMVDHREEWLTEPAAGVPMTPPKGAAQLVKWIERREATWENIKQAQRLAHCLCETPAWTASKRGLYCMTCGRYQ